MTNAHDEAVLLARSIFELRRRRSAHLPADLLSEAAWNMLLTMFVADADGRRIAARDAFEAAEVTAPVGQRWLAGLAKAGLVGAEGGGGADVPVSLTPAGVTAVRACMLDAQEYLRTIPGASRA